MGEGFPHISEGLGVVGGSELAISVSRTLVILIVEAYSSTPLTARPNRRRHAHAPSGEGRDGEGASPTLTR